MPVTMVTKHVHVPALGYLMFYTRFIVCETVRIDHKEADIPRYSFEKQEVEIGTSRPRKLHASSLLTL